MDQKLKSEPVSLLTIISKLGATIIITLFLGFLFHYFGKTEPTYYATFENEDKAITLPDSSLIFLTESSLLTVSSEYNKKDRNIELKGEAYVIMNYDKLRPFQVNVGKTQIEGVGASFNLSVKNEGNDINITVIEDSITFITAKEHTILREGVIATYEALTNKFETRDKPSLH